MDARGYTDEDVVPNARRSTLKESWPNGRPPQISCWCSDRSHTSQANEHTETTKMPFKLIRATTVALARYCLTDYRERAGQRAGSR